jgi:phosphomannomutase/phosphoglucomutase
MNNINTDIFRAYDIRGIVTTDLTPDAVELIGRAFGSEAAAQRQDTVVIARDGRLSSPELAQRLAKGIRATGRNVIDVGLAPTPVLYFATYHLNTGTGIMITGSHNPPEYNGLKMMLAGKTLHSDSIQDLLKRIQNDDILQQAEGTFSEEDVVPAYIERITSDIKLDKPIKFAYDCGNGAAGDVATRLFKALGCDADGLFTDIDGTFPNHHPDPSKPANLIDLVAKVKAGQLEVGLAFDGDGDRLGVVDKDGNIVWADRQMMLYAEDILSRNPGSPIVFDVKCTQNLAKIIDTAGGKPMMGKTGHSFVKAKMIETDALLGGEMSGHVFFKERWYGFDDGLYTAARLLEILSNDSRSPTEIFSALPDSVNTPEININFAEGEHYKFVEKFIAQAEFDGAEKVTIDGVRANFSDGWGLVRASNTTPCLVLRFEADSEAAIERIQVQFREQIRRVDPTLDLPF